MLFLRRASSSRPQQRVAAPSRRSAVVVYAAAATTTKTVKIGTRGSPLALAQAYLTRDLLKVRLCFFCDSAGMQRRKFMQQLVCAR